MSRELFEKCIDQLAAIGIDVLNLQFGGESLLHPYFKEFLEYAIGERDRGRIGLVGWTTNGMLFDETVADLVVSLKVDWINFSLDGLGKINDDIRLGSKYSTIEKNIKYLLKKRGNENKPVVLINTVDYGKTEEQKLEFFKEWVFIVDEIELLPSISSDNSWENKGKLSKDVELATPPPYCRYPLNTAIAAWDGRVTGCCFDTRMTVVLGDLNRDSFTEIWRNSNFQSLRASVILKKFSPESPCYKCDYWKVNFRPKDVPILDGKAIVEYGSMTRKIRRACAT
jgi:radical SAM protein with 4Fe4S-binding SPASM domain